jgi:hypothetical protein
MPLGRYRIVRGKRSPEEPLPEGVRQDTRKHTRHCCRPEPDRVAAFLAAPDDFAWGAFADAYRALLEVRFAEDPAAFEGIAQTAQSESVWLGCNCPTKKNPDVRRCHTWLALSFFAERFPGLRVDFPLETA